MQRQLRLGDILDDYCPRERRVTNHAIVAMIGPVTSRMGEPSPERGGRSRRSFAVTAAGLAEIRRSWNHAFAMAEGLEHALNRKAR